MRRRSTLARLLAIIASFGLCLASLRSGSPAWVGSLLTACIVMLTLALVAATSLRGRRRAFWAGFSLAGWLYLVLSSSPGLGSSVGPKLATTAILDLLYHFAYPHLAAPKPEPPTLGAQREFGMGRNGLGGMYTTDRVWYKSLGLEHDYFGWGGGPRLHSPEDYRRIGHSWMTLLVATIAGRLATALHSSRHGGSMIRPSKLFWLAIASLLAVGFLALRSPNRLEANALYSAALASLAMAPIAIVYRQGRERVFWTGFAICGWIYLVLTSFPILDTHIGVHLLTTPTLEMLYGRLAHRPPSTGPFNLDAWADWTDTDLNFDRRYVGDVVLVSSASFMRIGHSVTCLLVAIVGGRVAMRMCDRRDGASDERVAKKGAALTEGGSS